MTWRRELEVSPLSLLGTFLHCVDFYRESSCTKNVTEKKIVCGNPLKPIRPWLCTSLSTAYVDKNRRGESQFVNAAEIRRHPAARGGHVCAARGSRRKMLFQIELCRLGAQLHTAAITTPTQEMRIAAIAAAPLRLASQPLTGHCAGNTCLAE
jgi:hypothetical protein